MVFELPAALRLRIFHPGWAYGIAVILFGLFSCCLSVAKSYGSVIVFRLLLGFSEAYVQIGLVFLSLFYLPNEMAKRTSSLILPLTSSSIHLYQSTLLERFNTNPGEMIVSIERRKV